MVITGQSKEANELLTRLSEHHEEDVEESRQSSGHGESSTSGGKGQETSTSSFSLARAETRMVMYSKCALLFVIAIFTIAIGVTTFKFVKHQEHDDYDKKVRNS